MYYPHLLEISVSPIEISVSSIVIMVIPWVVRIYVEIIKAFASGLSCIHVENHDITIVYHLNQCRLCT